MWCKQTQLSCEKLLWPKLCQSIPIAGRPRLSLHPISPDKIPRKPEKISKGSPYHGITIFQAGQGVKFAFKLIGNVRNPVRKRQKWWVSAIEEGNWGEFIATGLHFPQNWTKREVGPSSGPKPHVELHINLLNLEHTLCLFLFRSYFSFGLVSCSISLLAFRLPPAFSTLTPHFQPIFLSCPQFNPFDPKSVAFAARENKNAAWHKFLVRFH